MAKTTTPDFRTELARLVDLYYALGGNWSPHGYTDTWNDALASACTALATSPPEAPTVMEALAARPLLEQVARLGDCIGANTVGEIMAISSRAAAWLAANPPGQPVAIEPRSCPTPGACSCVEPATPLPEPPGPPTDEERLADFTKWLAREMPPNTIIGDPLWWAPRIWRAALERWGR